MSHRESYPASQGFVHLSRRLEPGERVPACPSLTEQLLAASAAAARAACAEAKAPADQEMPAEDWDD